MCGMRNAWSFASMNPTHLYGMAMI